MFCTFFWFLRTGRIDNSYKYGQKLFTDNITSPTLNIYAGTVLSSCYDHVFVIYLYSPFIVASFSYFSSYMCVKLLILMSNISNIHLD